MEDPRLVALGLTTPQPQQQEQEEQPAQPAAPEPQAEPPDFDFPPRPPSKKGDRVVPPPAPTKPDLQFPPAPPAKTPDFQFPPPSPAKTPDFAFPPAPPTATPASSDFVFPPPPPGARPPAPPPPAYTPPPTPFSPPPAPIAAATAPPVSAPSPFTSAAPMAPVKPAKPVKPPKAPRPAKTVAAVVPAAPARPSASEELFAAIAKHPVAIRQDVRTGMIGRARIDLAPIGVAFVTRRGGTAYAWSEVKEIVARRGAIVIKTEAQREKTVKTKEGPTTKPYVEKKTRTLRVALDGAVEPAIALEFSRILDDMRSATFSYQSTSWLEWQNALERLRDDFHQHDDPFIPSVAGALWLLLGIAGLFIVPEIVNLASDIRPPAGAFAIQPRYDALDPRTIAIAFALSALLSRLVLRLGLGTQAVVWARGTLRGWHSKGARPLRFLAQQLARVLLGNSVAAALVLVGLAAFGPTIGTTLIVDRSGIRETAPLPYIGLERTWSDVSAIEKTESRERLERFGVTIRFADGRSVTTVGHDLSGGTDGQLYDRTNAWWSGAR